ncbi:gluconokinase [Planctomonas psychrotolerans]|uniref:gluconokinase n=1 Tax=Planctomonas psychrotolerans TaxID=2528712 RepID=UPI001D0D04BC|nr:gluconokinase [Planctomonas psychrotolerans]
MSTSTIPPIVVMGVSGSGKSTVGLDLAEELGASFIDGDDLHPPANKAKMAAGHPLDDDDRWPWLDAIGAVLATRDDQGYPPIVACSALKRVYRDRLRAAAPGTVFVHLHGSAELLSSRLGPRMHEYMPATLLGSQLDTLQPLDEDEEGVVVDIAPLPPEVTANAIAGLRTLLSSSA